MIKIIRGLIKAVKPAKSGGPARFDASGRTEEEFTDREMFQHYGFTSRPGADTQCLLVRTGQNIFMIASDGGRYKVDLKDGEVAVYDAFENVVHLQAGGDILVKAGGSSGKVVIEAAGEVSVKAGKAVVDAGDVLFGPEALGALAGTALTTANCLCLVTGAPHVVTVPGRVKIV